MAQALGAGKVKLNNGQVVTGQTGGWYDGQQFWNNTLGNAGEFNAQNNQAGQQGAAYVAPQDQPFINQQRQQANLPAQPAPVPVQQAPIQQPQATTAGTGVGVPASTAPATPNLQSILDTAITAGTKDYQTQFDTLTQQMTEREMAKNAQVAKIADNPYLSEATMTGRIAKINDKFNADKQTLTGQQGILQNQISTAKADAQVKVNIAQNQYGIDNAAHQQSIQQVNQFLSAGMLNNASGEDIANIAVTTGMSTSMVQSIIDASKAKNATPPQISTVSDSTGQYIVAIDPKNFTVIAKTKVGEAPKTTSNGITAYQSSQQDIAKQAAFEKAIADGVDQLAKGRPWGEVWNRIHTLYPEAPAALIDSLLGTSWREPGAYQNS